MGGISQCVVCGDLYYGDERDGYQTCRCVRPTAQARAQRSGRVVATLEPRWSGLSDLERLILRRRCEGVRIMDIAASLGRSRSFVEETTGHAIRWLGVGGQWRGRVARCCYELGRMDARAGS